MASIRTAVLAVLSVLLLIALALPAAADTDRSNWRVWDQVQRIWTHVDGTPFTSAATATPPMGKNAKLSSIARQTVPYDGKFKPGTIVVETSQFKLYYVMPGGQAIAYGIGVGRDGFRWQGQHAITRKAEWPGWTPPAQMRTRVPDLPAYMPGGPDNPLGARALYIGATLYRIHGTSEPWTIGQAVSSGCIRLTNDDIIDLYSRVAVGSLLVVHQ
jgi:lipoprotein-anchoring transpeptidase ErfK/SrfK